MDRSGSVLCSCGIRRRPRRDLSDRIRSLPPSSRAAGSGAARQLTPSPPYRFGRGRGASGLEALLHGPAQLWDAVQWVSCAGHGLDALHLCRRRPRGGGPAGSVPPQLMVDSPIDLITGVVPGGGLALLPVAGPDPFATPAADTSAPDVRGTASDGSRESAAAPESPAAPDTAGPPAVDDRSVAGTAMGGGAAAPRPSPMPGGGLSGDPAVATIVVPPPSGLGGGPGAPPAGPGPTGRRRLVRLARRRLVRLVRRRLVLLVRRRLVLLAHRHPVRLVRRHPVLPGRLAGLPPVLLGVEVWPGQWEGWASPPWG